MGVQVDTDKAVQLYKAAAERGLAEAQTALASLYLEGSIVEKNTREALRSYQLAAAPKHAPALRHLGDIHRKGVETPQDI